FASPLSLQFDCLGLPRLRCSLPLLCSPSSSSAVKLLPLSSGLGKKKPQHSAPIPTVGFPGPLLTNRHQAPRSSSEATFNQLVPARAIISHALSTTNGAFLSKRFTWTPPAILSPPS